MPSKKTSDDEMNTLQELRRQFIRIVSHQLRTPLSVVRWNLETLLGEQFGSLTDVQKEFIRVTGEAADEVIRRLDDLIVALEIERGEIRLHKEDVDLQNLWECAQQKCKSEAQIKSQTYEYKKPPKPLPCVTVDPNRMKEALQKLVYDAIEYTPAEGTITVRLFQNGESIRFEVQDTGIGVPEDEQKRIFERFYRGSNAHLIRPDGSGVSLSIAKYYVEGHGGKIGVKSREGEGSLFWVEVPIE